MQSNMQSVYLSLFISCFYCYLDAADFLNYKIVCHSSVSNVNNVFYILDENVWTVVSKSVLYSHKRSVGVISPSFRADS